MRIVLISATMLALMAPAYAQGMGGGGRGHRGQEQKATNQKPKVDEKAYKAALDSIPEPKGKVDPWGKMR